MKYYYKGFQIIPAFRRTAIYRNRRIGNINNNNIALSYFNKENAELLCFVF